jgi:SAM-dependent methyltransferase
MTKIDFDQYAGQYDALLAAQTQFFDTDSDYFARYKIERAKRVAGKVTAALDFGCGIGRSMAHLRKAFAGAEIAGCDPSADSLAIARRENPACQFFAMDELRAEPRFDLVLASCVFHHIAPAERQEALRYCYDRLKPGGRFVIFEHNPFNPVTRRLVSTCPFDADAVLLPMRETLKRLRAANFTIAQANYCLFFPGPLAALRPLENYMGWLPLGGQYFVCGIKT